MNRPLLAALIAFGALAALPKDAAAQRAVRCESIRGTPDRRIFCPMPTRFGVRVVEQLSRTPCIQGRNFFVERGGVFVRGGCRAVFVPRRGGFGPRPY
jgi:hypothetical protein